MIDDLMPDDKHPKKVVVRVADFDPGNEYSWSGYGAILDATIRSDGDGTARGKKKVPEGTPNRDEEGHLAVSFQNYTLEQFEAEMSNHVHAETILADSGRYRELGWYVDVVAAYEAGDSEGVYAALETLPDRCRESLTKDFLATDRVLGIPS